MLLKSASAPILTPESDVGHRFTITRSVSMSLSTIKTCKTTSEGNLRPWSRGLPRVATASLRGSLELDEGCHGGGGGVGFGGGRNGGGGDGSDGKREWGNNGSESVDGYYQKMIGAYPGDALLLGNYARFLKEVNQTIKNSFLGGCRFGFILSSLCVVVVVVVVVFFFFLGVIY